MLVIVFCGDKGGVGKSTVSNVCAQYLILLQNMKGALIDLDPQGNSSRYNLPKLMIRDSEHDEGFKPTLHPDYDPSNPQDWKAPQPGISSIADVFYGTKNFYPYSSWVNGLDIYPSYASQLEEAERQTRYEVQKNVISRMINFIDMFKSANEYDFIIIDTRPSKGPLTKAALSVATHVVFPVELEPWGMDGLWGMHILYKNERMKRSPENQIKLLGILPNKVRQVSLHQGYLEELKNMPELSPYLLPCVGQRVAFSESVAENATPRSVFELSDNNVAKIESLKWCNEAYRRLKNNG